LVDSLKSVELFLGACNAGLIGRKGKKNEGKAGRKGGRANSGSWDSKEHTRSLRKEKRVEDNGIAMTTYAEGFESYQSWAQR